MKDTTWQQLNAQIEPDLDRNERGLPSDAEILSAARDLGCTFCEDYVAFLKKYGSSTVGSFPIYGLRPNEMLASCWSVVEETKWVRSKGWEGTENWYVISEDGFGAPIGIAPDGRVMISDHNHGCIDEFAPNFEAFLLNWCLVEHDDSDLIGDNP